MKYPPEVTADNPLVWCRRCRRFHLYWTFTEENQQAIIAAASQNLAEAIDQQIADAVYRDMNRLRDQPWDYALGTVQIRQPGRWKVSDA